VNQNLLRAPSGRSSALQCAGRHPGENCGKRGYPKSSQKIKGFEPAEKEQLPREETRWHTRCKPIAAMKPPMRAPDWNVIMATIYALSAPGPAAFLAVGLLLALLGGILASLRNMLPAR
jgi:hypothetical protein